MKRFLALLLLIPTISFAQPPGSSFSTSVAVSEDRNTNIDGKEGVVTNSIMYGRVSDSIVKTARLDASTEAQMTVTYEHHEIHGGSHYFVDDVTTLAINAVFDMQLTTPAGSKLTHLTFEIDSENETEWYIYEGVTIVTPGAAVTPLNNYRDSVNSSGNTLKAIENSSLANANSDTTVAAATLIAHGMTGSGRSGGSNTRNREIILKANTNYCMRAVANAAGYINFVMQWYEHTDRN